MYGIFLMHFTLERPRDTVGVSIGQAQSDQSFPQTRSSTNPSCSCLKYQLVSISFILRCKKVVERIISAGKDVSLRNAPSLSGYLYFSLAFVASLPSLAH